MTLYLVYETDEDGDPMFAMGTTEAAALALWHEAYGDYCYWEPEFKCYRFVPRYVGKGPAWDALTKGTRG